MDARIMIRFITTTIIIFCIHVVLLWVMKNRSKEELESCKRDSTKFSVRIPNVISKLFFMIMIMIILFQVIPFYLEKRGILKTSGSRTSIDIACFLAESICLSYIIAIRTWKIDCDEEEDYIQIRNQVGFHIIVHFTEMSGYKELKNGISKFGNFI